ncbi:putative late blight resistance protein homolog R1B-8 isoform X2 [Nicotiana tabacum]|uniref:Late blight resistance protein homolog R1A-10 isoform X2 n=1 Tax=Nicotiana tabacum TaxID=4097 RepID=A0A1S3YWC8_TOBAC|nr:PREDICTED: putative late blight resistance protein homolog R1A-10 isoform X2 [Nicotiana tabacum]XP_016456331.1 PREDICTED: putative late blight resistance protein homolog R1A-10 isoform X2 [Nicotiana tabacum]
MAAYAAVTSLMGTIHLISQSNLDLQDGHKDHLKLLYEKVSSLLEFLDTNSDDEPMKDLQEKVKDLAHEVEDKVESHIQREAQKKFLKMLQRVFHLPTKAHERLLKNLQRDIEAIDSIKEELFKQRENNNMQAGNSSLGGSNSLGSHVSTLENNMVGYNDEQASMLRQLTGDSRQLEVISIVGMGGIGKSTFAKRVFSDPSVVGFFDVRGWITMSKDYSIRKMLLSLLQDAGVDLDKVSDEEQADHLEESDEETVDHLQKINNALADRLQKSLKGRRYLIVVDDIWSTDAWDEIKLWFPEYNNRSRILLTTRDMKVAQYASFPEDPFPMRFLDPEESWNLFCQKAFDKKTCPIELKNVANEVVENCKGLPLMISVIAGTLSSKRTLDEWRKVANSVSSLVNLDDYQRCSGVLALSYNHLPSHLKACFLYFGVFPKATDISVKKLIRLWVAEGLLELKRLEGLEKVAAYLLHDLIDKSLIIVSRRSFDGKIKTCRIHDLLHDLCWREAESDSILYVVNDVPYGGPRRYFPQGRRWVSLHLAGGYYPTLFSALSYSKTRSVHFYADPVYNLQLEHFKLLRVLDLEATEFQYGFPREILRLVCLRYLVMKIDEISEHIPISNLQNLQTLVIFTTSRKGFINLRDGIWDMSQLRHLNCSRIFLYPPPNVSPNEVEYPSLENLQSVCGLSSSCCTKEIFKGIKKVKKMGISCDSYSESEWLANLKYLLELEALSIASSSYYGNVYSDFRLPCPGSFPPNLKKLTLCCTRLSWEDMTIISKLPKLEVLQLKEDDFARSLSVGERVWEVTEMGFPELKFLLLEKLILDYWRATDDYFPCLEHVIIKNCSLLKEIPQGFADSMTLKLIMLQGCSPSVVTSAEWIQREQLESSGTDMLRVYAVDTRDSDQDY